MWSAFRNIFKIPDLRKRVLFTLGVIIILQLGYHITVPLVNSAELNRLATRSGGIAGQGTLLGLLDMFSGGAFNRFSIFAMGIMPYISASIIMQLLTVVVPFLEELNKKGEEGRKKINQYTRYLTVAITFIQSYMLTYWIVNVSAAEGYRLVDNPNQLFRLLAALSITTGTLFIMWLGERITERGIGNGISLIIFANIVARLPVALRVIIGKLLMGTGAVAGSYFRDITVPTTIIIGILMVTIVAAIVVLTQGQRRIPIKRGRQTVGRRTYGGQMSYLPIKINVSGVIPVIFASALLGFPATIAQFSNSERIQTFATTYLSPGHWLYQLLYVTLIIFFCYFYTAIVFNPKDVAENLRKYGSTVPGYSHGRKTELYIDYILTRITLFGAFFLAIIAVIPEMMMAYMKIPRSVSGFLGGTSMIIVVGVALDTIRAIENHLLLRNYDGFRKKGRVKARR